MAPPYPILLISHNLEGGGSERQVTQMARALDRRLFDPHVCCFREGGLRQPELRLAGVPVHVLPLSSFRSPSALRSLRLFGRIVREHGIRLVHAFDVPGALFGVPAARVYRVPVVLSSQRAFRILVSPVYRHLLRVIDRMVDGIVVNSRAVGRDLTACDRVPGGLIHLCHNGIDTDQFHPAATPQSRTGLVIGSLAAFRREKDHATLLAAFARLRRVFPGVKLRLAGGGELDGELRRRARELALEDSCSIEPAIADAASFLRSIDIFVLPSISEALSNSLMEAMACGCCVIASRVGGNPEIVCDGENGLLFQPGNIEELATCLERTLGDARLRLRLACAAARHIRDKYPIRAAAKRLRDIYLPLLQTLAG